jgi:hypothetical protein
MTDQPNAVDLSALPQLRALFEHLNAGRHLNRHHDHALWVDLEQNQATYEVLFSALGYALRIDGRGFAWFHGAEATSSVSRNSRRLALFFLLLFEYQADQGLHLGKFHSWTLDRALLDTLWEKNKALLETEEISDPEALADVLRIGERYGIVAREQQRWQLLPAAYRYLDHFEELAAALREQEAADAALAQWEDEA